MVLTLPDGSTLPSRSATVAPTAAVDIGFLVMLRAVACLLVVYCHLIGYQVDGWFVEPFIDRFIGDPLGIIWDFGYLGVAIFFVISGFIITHVAQRETRFDFAIKRLFRVYPPFLVALLVALVLAHLGGRPQASMSASDVLWEASLFGSAFKLLGPSWTLVVELMFYALATAILPLMRTRPFIATLIVGILPTLVRLAFGDAVKNSDQRFLVVFAVGMAIYYVWAGRLGLLQAVILSMVAWCGFVWATGTSDDARGFEVNTVFAVILFVLVLWANPRPRPRSAITAISKGSYSLYLLHAPVGEFVLAGLRPVLGYSATIVICLIVVAGVTWVSYTFIERPSQRAARWLIGAIRAR